jgi:hypothetical protein
MAVDLQVVFPQEAVLLNNIRILPGPPRTVDVIGADFRSVDEVLINRVESTDVVVLSKTRLLAQVPDFLGSDKQILSVTVLSRRLTFSPRSLLRFRIGKTPGRVVGILRLVQKFLKILFTTPGTDIFNKNLGGGGLRNIGATFGYGDGDQVLNELVVAIDTTARQIVGLQSREPSIPLDERLLSAKILRAGFNKDEGAIDIAVEVVSQAGRAAVANLEL